jgi:hypothetical protein
MHFLDLPKTEPEVSNLVTRAPNEELANNKTKRARISTFTRLSLRPSARPDVILG